MERGIWYIIHFLDNCGNILTYNTFTEKYNLVCTNWQYNTVIKAIPQAMFILIKGMLTYSVVIPTKPSLVIDGCSFLDLKKAIINY